MTEKEDQSILDEYRLRAKNLKVPVEVKSTPISTGNTATTTTTTSSSQLVSTSELVYVNPRPTTLYLPVEIVHRFKLRCLELRVTMSLVLSHLIADWLGGKLRVPELEKGSRPNKANPLVWGLPNRKFRFK